MLTFAQLKVGRLVMVRTFLFALSLGLMILGLGRAAVACGPCEYKDSLGLCLPKGGCLVPNLGDVIAAPLSLAAAVASGNPENVKVALGNALVNSPGCIGCNYVATKIAPNLSDEQRKSIIGRGFLTFLATGSPVLVVIDVATNLSTQHPLSSDESPPVAPVPPSRGTRTYSGNASCIIQKGTQIYGAWVDAPVLKDDASGQTATYPVVDLLAGDTLVLNAPVCSEQDDASTGQHAIASANLRYERSSTTPGGPTQLKYFLYGSQAPSVPIATK
jgi:hypothetical protein